MFYSFYQSICGMAMLLKKTNVLPKKNKFCIRRIDQFLILPHIAITIAAYMATSQNKWNEM